MQRLQLDAFLQSLSPQMRREASLCITELVASIEHSSFQKTVMSLRTSALMAAYNNFINVRCLSDSTFAFWTSYIDIVKLLLHFITATRTSDWHLHLASVRCMIPWFFAYDHIHYARYLPAYWLEMMSLPTTHPECYTSMSSGKWTVQRQDRHGFSAIACDQAIEQTCNRDSKTRGGISGLTRHPGAAQRWILTQHDRAALTRQCGELAGIAPETRRRKDLDSTRTSQNELAVQKVISTVKSMINPFDLQSESDDLTCISSGTIADNDVKSHLLQALEIGEKAAMSFIQQRLMSTTTQDTCGIYEKMPKLKLKTFTSTLKKKVSTKDGKQVFIRNDRDIFARLLVIGQRRDIDLRDVLSHSLGSVSFPLASSDGGLAKTNKSALLKILIEKAADPFVSNAPENAALIIDGMALIQCMSSTGTTFGDLARTLITMIARLVEKMKSGRVDFVCDQYLDCSIKTPERSRRGSSNSHEIKIYSQDQKTPIQWKKFLASGKNKEALINFLFNTWKANSFEMLKCIEVPFFFTSGEKCCMSVRNEISSAYTCMDVPELQCDHEEADTRLLLHAKHASHLHSDVVVRCADTDVAVLLCTMSSAIPANLYFANGSHNNPQILDINNVVSSLGPEMCDALIGLHAFTGCDSTSAFYGKGKRKAFQIARSNPLFLRAFADVGKNFDLQENLQQTLEQFVCKLYEQNVSDVNEARYRVFCLAKPSEQSLPPTKDALTQHSMRANYQAAVFKRALETKMLRPCPSKFGWEIKNGEIFIKWMTKKPAPDMVFNFVHCKCKTSKCNTKSCSCHKVELNCTELCQCTDCDNSAEMHSEDSSDSDLSDEEL